MFFRLSAINVFKMVLWHFVEILLIKSEKLTAFAKRYVIQIIHKGLKKPYFDVLFWKRFSIHHKIMFWLSKRMPWSGLSSALRIMVGTLRTTNHFLFKKIYPSLTPFLDARSLYTILKNLKTIWKFIFLQSITILRNSDFPWIHCVKSNTLKISDLIFFLYASKKTSKTN